MTTLTFPTPPTLPRLYAKAAVASLRPIRLINPDSLPSLDVVVEQAAVSQDTLSRYHRLAGGYTSDFVDSVALHGLGFGAGLALMAREEFPLPLAGAVHLSNRAQLYRPVRAGEVLRLRVKAESLLPHHAGTTVELVAEAFSGDDLVHMSRSTYLAKGVGLRGVDRPARPVRAPFVAPLPTGQWSLPASTGRAWAETLGDWNPIHLSGLSARALGQKHAIAHGTYLAARSLAGLARADVAHSWQISFGAPVRLPGQVAFAQGRAGTHDGGERACFLGWDRRSNRENFRGHVQQT